MESIATKTWLDELKVGDKVIAHEESWDALGVVRKVVGMFDDHIDVGKMRYRREDGRATALYYPYTPYEGCFIEEATAERLQAIKDKRRKAQLVNALRAYDEWHGLSLEELERVAVIAKVRE